MLSSISVLAIAVIMMPPPCLWPGWAERPGHVSGDTRRENGGIRLVDTVAFDSKLQRVYSGLIAVLF